MGPSDEIGSAAPPPARQAAAGRHEHVVEFYETEEFLADTVTDFVGPGLHDGGAAVVVATSAHRYALERSLRHSDLIHRRRPDGAPPPADDGPLTAVFRHRRTVRSREDTLVRREGGSFRSSAPRAPRSAAGW